MINVFKFISPWLKKPKLWFLDKRDTWIRNKIPSNNTTQLNINNTFILPSKFGVSCIGIAICLFVLGTNFQNNIILLLCYFILAMLLLSIFHSYFFFTQHKITFSEIPPDYENRRFFLPVYIQSSRRYSGGNIVFSVAENSQTVAVGKDETHAKLKLPDMKRGLYVCPSVSLFATYGFGLFKCYSQLSPKLSVLVYPRMQKSSLTLAQSNSNDSKAMGTQAQLLRTDDLQGIREYRDTDSLRHVSWKHAAKGQGLLTKSFVDNKGMNGWLRLDDFRQLGIEEALRCLCYQVQQLDKEQVTFGLDLGSQKVFPQLGDLHVKNCLMQLALFSQPTEQSKPTYDLSNQNRIKRAN